MRYSTTFLLVLSLVVLTSCGVNISPENITSTPVFVTATLPASAIPLPTQTLPPPTPIPTIPPVEGTTTTQINVRAETSSASKNLGTVAQFSKIQIIGKDSSANWYQIIYASASNGTGWIRAEYVQVDAAAEIPVIETDSSRGSAVSGIVIQKINVRNGPDTTFNVLGELNPNDVVFISGKDESGLWIQIEFANSADGKAWAALEFLKIENASSLPVIKAEIAASATVENVNNSQAIESSFAMPDGDSIEAPSTNINFSPLGARAVQIKGSVSSVSGDAEDWVQLTSQSNSIAIHLFCSTGALQVELIGNDKVTDSFFLECSEKRLLNVTANQIYLLRLSETNAGGANQTNYMLVLESVR